MRAGSFAAVLLLAGCSGAADQPTPAPTPSPTQTVAAPRKLIAADLDMASLGPRIAGVEQADGDTGEDRVRVTAFVACPKPISVCDPGKVPEDTPFTYVITITPGPPGASRDSASPGSARPSNSTASSTVAPVDAPAELFRMVRPAPFFDGAVGYSRAEAAAALGREDALTVTLDQNQIIWRVTGGSGWQAGKPITLWWRTPRPPAKAVPAYRLEHAGQPIEIRAPFPAADKAVERTSGG